MAFVRKKNSEFYASTTNAGKQEDPRVEALPNGGYVVVWESDTGAGIRAQRFDASGAMAGGEIVVGSSGDYKSDPELAVLTSGEFVIVWVGRTAQNQEYVLGQRYGADGSLLGGEFTFGPVGGAPFGNYSEPSVFALPNGGFVTTWQGVGMHAQIYSAAGAPVGGPLLIDAEAIPYGPIGTAVGSDRFFISWLDLNGGGERSWKGQVFDLAGNKIGSELLMPSGLFYPVVTALADGGFVLAWEARIPSSPSNWAIYAQRYDANGAAVGSQLVASTATAQTQGRSADVTALPWGGFVVSWFDTASATIGMKGQLFGADGSKLGGIFQINTEAVVSDMATFNRRLDVALLSSGELVAVWGNEAGGSTQLGIKAQHLAMPVAGTSGGDTIAGTADDDAIMGLGGNDFLLLQQGGDDIGYGGDGNDVIYFGTALSAGDVADGGDGRDAIVLQGNVTVVLSATNIVNIESISLQSGANSFFGDTGNNFYDFNVTTADGNVPAGQLLIVNAQSLRAGEDFTFDGSAETDGTFRVYGGHGTDILKGGAGVDVFFFEGARWTAGDRVDGGGGRDAVVISAGSGVTHIEFAADAFTSIESISLNNLYASDPSQKPSYDIVLHNGNVAAGATLIVNGSSITGSTQFVNVDGSAVHDGNLKLYGGAGKDVLTGGFGADVIVGGGGGDEMTGGPGDYTADRFEYYSIDESTVADPDEIFAFQVGSDKIDLSRIDANTLIEGNQSFKWVGSGPFTVGDPTFVGQLRVFQVDGVWFVEGEVNGDGVADMAFQVTTVPGPMSDLNMYSFIF